MISFLVRRMGSDRASCDRKEEDILSSQAKNALTVFFFFNEMGTDFTAPTSRGFYKIFNRILSCHQVECEFPSYQELKVWILQYMVKEMLHNVHGIRDTWAIMWSNIIVDGWKDEKGRNLMNFFVDCPRVLIYLILCYVSALIDDVDALVLLFEQVIEDVGVQNVVQIVSHSTSEGMEAVGHSLVEKCQTVFWRVSASHFIEMIFEKIGMMGNIREILDKAKTVTRFIHSYAAALNHMRNHTCVHDLVKASKSKLAILILTLLNIASEKWGWRKCLSQLSGRPHAGLPEERRRG